MLTGCWPENFFDGLETAKSDMTYPWMPNRCVYCLDHPLYSYIVQTMTCCAKHTLPPATAATSTCCVRGQKESQLLTTQQAAAGTPNQDSSTKAVGFVSCTSLTTIDKNTTRATQHADPPMCRRTCSECVCAADSTFPGTCVVCGAWLYMQVQQSTHQNMIYC